MAPWAVLAGGKLRTDVEEQQRIDSGEGGRTMFGDWLRTENERKVCSELEKVAAEVGAKNIRSVAIAWIMQKAPYVFPIIGGRKVEQLYENIEALEISLSDEQIKKLDNIVPFDKGILYSFFVSNSACWRMRVAYSLYVNRVTARITISFTSRAGTSRTGRRQGPFVLHLIDAMGLQAASYVHTSYGNTSPHRPC